MTRRKRRTVLDLAVSRYMTATVPRWEVGRDVYFLPVL